MQTVNMMIAGVGGQGSLLASKLLGHLLLAQGYAVKVSEVHGMSQRGGSVVTNVRYGSAVYSPRIDVGEADCILSFELLEGVRWLEHLRPGGRLIVSSQQIAPMPVITGAAEYPPGLAEKIQAAGVQAEVIDALAMARQAGSPKAVNLVLLGRLSRHLDLPEAAWQEAIEACVPPRFLELNRRAFALGRGT